MCGASHNLGRVSSALFAVEDVVQGSGAVLSEIPWTLLLIFLEPVLTDLHVVVLPT